MAKTILTKEEADRIAATCYLAIWQIEEFGTDLYEDLSPQPFKDILAILDYPTDPVFDNDSCPVITWQAGQFHSRFQGDEPREDYEGINSLFGDGTEQ